MRNHKQRYTALRTAQHPAHKMTARGWRKIALPVAQVRDQLARASGGIHHDRPGSPRITPVPAATVTASRRAATMARHPHGGTTFRLWWSPSGGLCRLHRRREYFPVGYAGRHLCGAEPRRGASTETSGNGAGPGSRDRNAGRGSIPHSGPLAAMLRSTAPHRRAGTRNIPRIRLFRWSCGMRTPALKAPDGRKAVQIVSWPGSLARCSAAASRSVRLVVS
jgi:hypothetical protein